MGSKKGKKSNQKIDNFEIILSKNENINLKIEKANLKKTLRLWFSCSNWVFTPINCLLFSSLCSAANLAWERASIWEINSDIDSLLSAKFCIGLTLSSSDEFMMFLDPIIGLGLTTSASDDVEWLLGLMVGLWLTASLPEDVEALCAHMVGLGLTASEDVESLFAPMVVLGLKTALSDDADALLALAVGLGFKISSSVDGGV